MALSAALGVHVQTPIIIAAHPDDEVLGASTVLAQLPGITIAHVTDGAPRNMYDVRRHGFETCEEYAAARHLEFTDALAAGGVRADCLRMNFADQTASYQMRKIAISLAEILRARKPDFVFTHPYEGGHPDHDACALAVHAAVRLACMDTSRIWEFTSYHWFNGQLRTTEFLAGDENVKTVNLTPAQQQTKRRMLACFRTQQETLNMFDGVVERYRPAPMYDFTKPPHDGKLYYEMHDWGVTGDKFRQEAKRCLCELGLRGEI